MSSEWDWNKMIPSWDFYDIQLSGYPGWEPRSIIQEHRKGVGKSSRDQAIEWDDISRGNFHYRDWTESGMPFLSTGEPYRSIFTFQFVGDYMRFRAHFGIDWPTIPARIPVAVLVAVMTLIVILVSIGR